MNRGNVALICGGGSGHEPAHAGFVGEYFAGGISDPIISITSYSGQGMLTGSSTICNTILFMGV